MLPFGLAQDLLTVPGQLYLPCRREFKDKPPSQWSASQESARASPFKRRWRRENVGKRQLAVHCHVQVWRFDVENDKDVRDAVVADDGGGGERADAAAGTAAPKSTTVTESSVTREDVEPHQRLRVESPKRGATGREEGVL